MNFVIMIGLKYNRIKLKELSAHNLN